MVAGVLVVAAVLVQLTLLNRLTLPGGEVPDLVLLVVVACG
ncbi:rod shape-determining protein MreD, partial [Spongiactinospora gelatinilytica]